MIYAVGAFAALRHASTQQTRALPWVVLAGVFLFTSWKFFLAGCGGLIVGTAGLALWLWSGGLVSLGAIALACGLVIRINNMSGWIRG